MLEYCERDVELTALVYDALVTRMNKLGYSELSAEIEHRIRYVVDKQERNGFWFDRVGAEGLHQFLRKREADLSEPIQKLFPPKLETVGEYLKSRRADGSRSAQFVRHAAAFSPDRIIEDVETGSYRTLDLVPFNIGSPKQRLERLLELGYEPTAKTKKGNPRIDEDSLMEYARSCGRPEIAAMAEWLVCNGRANMIETWLGYVQADSRIHGKVFTCGAATRRCKHSSPNTANIPSEHNGAAYGRECRALWGVEPGKDLALVGYDAKGLETVGLCHYLNNPTSTTILTEGDIHTLNQEALTKALKFEVVRGGGGSKNLWYAFLYGAYDKKLGEILKKGPRVGAKVRETLIGSVPGLKKLTEDTEDEFKASGGLLKTVDGGFVRCPSSHAALNYRIQSLGGIVMKLTSIILDKKLRTAGIEHKKVADIHDEGQHETKETDAETVGRLAVVSIKEAAEQLNFKVPLGGDFKVGLNWASTH